MQNADQREEAPRGVDVQIGFALKPLLQDAGPLVVDAAPRHIDRLDLAGGELLDRVEIAFADLIVVLHDLPERPQRQMERSRRLLGLGRDVKHQTPFTDRELQAVGSLDRAAAIALGQCKGIVFQQVKDRDASFLLDLRCRRRQGAVVDLDMCDPAHVRRIGEHARPCNTPALVQSFS